MGTGNTGEKTARIPLCNNCERDEGAGEILSSSRAQVTGFCSMRLDLLRRAALAAGTEGAQVIKGVDPRAMAIMPAHFDCVVSYWPDFD